MFMSQPVWALITSIIKLHYGLEEQTASHHTLKYTIGYKVENNSTIYNELNLH